MKSYIIAIALLLSALTGMTQVDRSQLPKPSTPRPINLGKYETVTLKNGLQVFIIENHKLPRVSYNLVFDRTAIAEGDKAGYLNMVGQMLRRGTQTRSKEQLDEEIDFIGASISASSTSVFASGLSKYADQILELMTDVAFNPSFPEEELEKIRKQALSALAQSKENPDAISGLLNAKTVFGYKHPYGQVENEQTVNNITVQDLIDYHATYFKPNIAYLAIVGDIDPKKIKKQLKTYFGSWETGTVPQHKHEKPQAPEKNQVNLVNRSNAVQSVISVTYPVDLPVGHADEIKVRLMNEILGGGFSGKLNMNLREDKGYTYGARSSLPPDRLMTSFSAGASVRNAVTDSAIVQIIYEMNQMIQGNFTEVNLDLAKNSVAGAFSRSLESPQTVASHALNQARYKLPADYYSTYTQRVQAVTLDDIKAMAAKYLKPNNMHINVVGKGSEIGDRLKAFGEITYYDASGNVMDPSKAKLPEGLTGKMVMENHIKAIGGRENLAKIKNYKIAMKAEMMGQKLDVERTKEGSKMLMEVKMGGAVINKQVFNGTSGLASGMGGEQKIEGTQAEDMAITEAMFTEITVLDRGLKAELVAVEDIDGQDAYAVEVTLPSGKITTLYYDVKTGLMVRTANQIDSPRGPVTMAIDFDNYQEFNGVKFPLLIKQPMGGGMKMEIVGEKVEVNIKLPADLFK
jgi:zinc protease